jgi:predicted nucleic acid-binding protein
MIVLDTNVVSEAMKPEPHPKVRAWLNQQMAQTLYLSSVTVAELSFGIAALPKGKRKAGLQKVFEGVMAYFEDRILPFDNPAALRYGALAVAAKNRGLGLPTPDGYIAAIAFERRFMVASRDVTPFQAAGVEVVNPWLA